MTRPLAERITESFYAWELRGRGWSLSDYPVSLEPPYRPIFLLPSQGNDGVCDDGKRPTFLSSLALVTKNIWKSGNHPFPALPAPPFEEMLPFPAPPSSERATLTIRVPADFAAQVEVAQKLLLTLSTALQPLCFEIVGRYKSVVFQITCAASDTTHVIETIRGYVPDAVVTEESDILVDAWDIREEGAVIDFGLSHEFFLPLQAVNSFTIDPYIPLVGALGQMGADELGCVQILFARVRNPWAESARDAVNDGKGGCIFADAPEFVKLTREKTETPLFAVVIRIAAQGMAPERAWSIARSLGSFFLQFARSGSNELIPLDNDAYPDELHTQALLARESYRTGMILSLPELSGLVHFPDASVLHEALHRERKSTKALPEVALGHHLILGENIHRGICTPATLGTSDRLQHVHVIGASGTGKSTLLLNLIEQDIAKGEGVAVFDPHGDLIEEILARVPEERTHDVVVFDPGDEAWPMGFNVLSATSEIEKNLIASDMVGIFKRLATSWGDTMSAVLGNAVLAMLEGKQGGTLLDLRRFLLDDMFRKRFLAEIADEEIRFFWHKEYPLIGSRSIGPILTRLNAFLRAKLIRNIVGQKGGTLDISKIMNVRKVLLVKLSHGIIGEENAHLLGSLLVSKFHQSALLRQQVAKDSRSPYFLYLDEFQHFVTPSMSSLLTDSRKYALGLTLAHQTLAQLDDSPVKSAVLGNAHTRIVFRVDYADVATLARGFASFDAEDVQNLSRGEAVVRMGRAENDFNLHTFPATHIEQDVARARSASVIAHSREMFATPRAVLEEGFRTAQEPQEAAVVGAVTVAEEKREATQKEKALATRKREITPPVLPPSPPTLRAHPIPPPEPSPLGRGGQEHKYLQHLVKRLGEERGFRAIIEEQVPNGQVDVVLRKESLVIACEISITTNVDHEVENIQKCLASGFTKILFITPDAKRREKVGKKLKEVPNGTLVDLLGPEDILPTLDRLDTMTPTQTTVRGYKVKVTRQTLSPADVAERRSVVAQVIARSLSRVKKG
ncbi:MAG: type IV secretion system DNA-binding domain-containing protein [Patescibacteria group bacterium]